MKLEVGMFIRTPLGIDKIINVILQDEYGCNFDTQLEHNLFCDERDYISIDGECFDKEEIKASHNIKKLIGVGDIISYEFPTGLGMIGYENVTVLPELLEVLQNGENNHEYIIKSILTKEQFESMSYKVKEEE